MTSDSHKKYDRPVIRLGQPDDSHKIQPLPPAAGRHPYRLQLDPIAAVSRDKFSFHMVGDTGGVRHPGAQQDIAAQMQRQAQEGSEGQQPAFLYHLGDVVYHYGEAEQYEQQFFKPYRCYAHPIFAIAGNHDSDVNPDCASPYESLDAFRAVFCDSQRRPIKFNEGGGRSSMVQPNIYWTLVTPLAHIIGLHSNVPKYGFIGEEQKRWFVGELTAAAEERPDKIIIVCLHHAPYSADVNHGSSLPMIAFLEEAFAESGVRPDIVFSGHVHNYQRFHKACPDGKMLPFIVCGAGGFDELHSLAEIGDPAYSSAHPLLEDVRLQYCCDDRHGFLEIALERTEAGIALSGGYHVLCGDGSSGTLGCRDRFDYLFQ